MSLEKNDYIINIMGYFNEKYIEYLMLSTNREKKIEVGSLQHYAYCKKFEFNITKSEKPLYFLGAVDIFGKKKFFNLFFQFKKKKKKENINSLNL